MTKPPAPGEVFRYPYLWRREADAGETEGRKRRPICVAVVSAADPARTLLFIVAITSRPPGPARVALAVPEIEARRAGIDATRSWVILDEMNVDILERSYAFEDRTPLGRFSAGFTRSIQTTLRDARRASRLGATSRI